MIWNTYKSQHQEKSANTYRKYLEISLNRVHKKWLWHLKLVHDQYDEWVHKQPQENKAPTMETFHHIVS